MFQTRFGKFISSLRNEKGLTQDELAEKLHVSSGKIISKWENGNTLPDFEMIMQLSKELDISLYELSVCEKVKSKIITKEDILKIVDKDHLKKITLKKRINLIIIFIIGIIALLSIIFTVTNFNTTQVYKLESRTSEFEVHGSYTKTKDYSVFTLTDIIYMGDNKQFIDTQIISYDYELLYNTTTLYHNTHYKTIDGEPIITMKNVIPRISILIDSATHDTKSIRQNNELILMFNYKNAENINFKLEIPIKLVEKSKNNKFW